MVAFQQRIGYSQRIGGCKKVCEVDLEPEEYKKQLFPSSGSDEECFPLSNVEPEVEYGSQSVGMLKTKKCMKDREGK
jgi:hypothetical protein